MQAVFVTALLSLIACPAFSPTDEKAPTDAEATQSSLDSPQSSDRNRGTSSSSAQSQADVAPKRKELAVGDPAPPLTILRWLQGNPVTEYISGQLYVVELGATWCGPCRKAIPHLTELQAKHAGKVTIIGVFVQENDRGKPGDVSYVDKVAYQLKSMGNQMGFTIAVDVPQQITDQAWGTDEVPKTFIVDGSGKIAWIGHPTRLEPVLEQLIAGDFDSGQAKREEEYFNSQLRNIDWLVDTGEKQAALDLVARLMKERPDQRETLYASQYRVLVGMNAQRANELLKWMLKQDLQGFSWDRLLSYTYRSSEAPDYELAMLVADRAIAEAETPIIAAQCWVAKGEVFVSRASNTTDLRDVAQNLSAAIEAGRQAVATSNSSEDAVSVQISERALKSFEFKYLLASGDAASTTDFLKGVLRDDRFNGGYSHTVNGFWSDLVDDVNRSGRTARPDREVVLQVVDRIIMDSEKRGSPPAFGLSKMAEVYLAYGDRGSAITAYQRAIAAASPSMSWYAKRLERKLSGLQAMP